MSREATNRILEMIEDGALGRDNVIMACLKYMSEDDVAEMARINDFGINEISCSECGDSFDPEEEGQETCSAECLDAKDNETE